MRSNPKPTPRASEQPPTLLSPILPNRVSRLDAAAQHPQPTANPATSAKIEKLIGRSSCDESYANSKTRTPASQATPPNDTAHPRTLIDIADVYTTPLCQASGVVFDRFGWAALVEHHVVEGNGVCFVPFQVISHFDSPDTVVSGAE